MSAESFLLYYGVRLSVQPAETKALEWGDHTSLVAADAHGLDTWWGNFSSAGEEEYYLFVGRQLAILGAEYDDCRTATLEEFRDLAEETTTKLRNAGFQQAPALWAQWEPDF
jgi:hypothetical protein